MTQHHPILSEIEAFIARTGMAETYFGKKSVNNSELVARLRAGGGIHFNTEARVRSFINNSPSSLPEAESLPSKKRKNARSSVQGPAKGAA